MKQPISINHLRPSIDGFKKIFQFHIIAEQLKLLPTTVLHLYGIPGSGKSEIVRKLAQEFPFANIKPKVYIKWHIQCQNTGHDIKEALKELVMMLQKRYFLPCREDVQDILDSIDDDEAHLLTKTLKQLEVPVLLVIEDLKDNTFNELFMTKFLNSIDDTEEEEPDRSLHLANKLHVYLTTRKAPTRRSSFLSICVKGFSEEEGVNFLLEGDKVHKANETSARKVVKMFSGSPLGLRAARGYCRCTHNLDYSLYLKDVEEEDNEVQEDEEELLKNDPGCATSQHIFQLIIKHFLEDEDLPKQTFSVLSCLSYFHHDLIPRQLIDRCFQLLQSKEKQSMRKSKFTSGLMIEKLKKYEMCFENKDGCLSFHALIMHAFRRHSLINHQTADLLPLKMGIWVLASLVTKDLTKSETSESMYRLLIHGQKLLKNVERCKEHLFTGEQRERFLLMVTVSHLYETIGRIRMAKSPADLSLCDEYFKHAVMIIWHKSDTLASLNTLCEENAEVFQVAKKVIQDCQKAGRRLDLNFTTEWQSKLLMNFDEDEKKFLASHCTSPQTFQEELKRKLSKPNLNSKEIVELLRQNKLLLDENKYRNVFFADRLSSIFHTWSRILLYKDKFSQEFFNRHQWYSRLSYAISVECSNAFGINLLSKHLSIISGMIPIVMKSKDRKLLPEDLKLCEDLLCPNLTETPSDSLYYEHGKLKEIYVRRRKSGRMSVLRPLVQMHTRLNDSLYSDKGDKACVELLELSKEQLGKVSIAGICIVHCAKYLASRERFAEALDCTNMFLSKHINKPRSHNEYSWGVYNHARIVLIGQLCEEKEAAACLCKNALESNDMIGYNLNKKLSNILKKLKTM